MSDPGGRTGGAATPGVDRTLRVIDGGAGDGRPPSREAATATDRAIAEIRSAILNPDAGNRVADRKDRDPIMPPPPNDGDPCPVTALGQLDGVCHFLDVGGQHRALTARQLGTRHDLVMLFGGDDRWLRHNFPKKEPPPKTKNADEQEAAPWRTVDFRINDAAGWLQRASFGAGLFSDHIAIRQPGVWRRDPDGRPVVHCGDVVMIEDDTGAGRWHPAGARTGNQIWAAAPPTARPGPTCDASVGRALQDGLRSLWRWREPGAPIAILGLIGNAYFGAAPQWRPGGFVTGEAGSGKSALVDFMRATLPLHYYDNDTTKAGIEQAVHSRAMPIIIDEAADRANRNAARDLADLMLSASGGEGTRGSRGTVDGKGRRIELAGLICMFSINPPELEPQHLGRLTLIDLVKPDAGADFREQHEALARFARSEASALWGRALASWNRYCAALRMFREGLREAGCAPREMDQAGALLAGHWILTEEGLPDARRVHAGLMALHGGDTLADPGLIRLAADIEIDGRPQRMMQHLLASMVNLHRSSERAPVGKLIEIAWGDSRTRGEALPLFESTHDDGRQTHASARELLSRNGIRVVSACRHPVEARPAGVCRPDGCSCFGPKGRAVPRGSLGAGAWFSATNPQLRALFSGTPYEGDRWRHEMLRLPGAMKCRSVRIGPAVVQAIWLGREVLDPDEGPP